MTHRSVAPDSQTPSAQVFPVPPPLPEFEATQLGDKPDIVRALFPTARYVRKYPISESVAKRCIWMADLDGPIVFVVYDDQYRRVGRCIWGMEEPPQYAGEGRQKEPIVYELEDELLQYQ